MADQDSIDSLFESSEQTNEPKNESENQSDSTIDDSLTTSSPASDEHTSESSLDQGEVVEKRALKPWVDYVPVPDLKRPTNPEEGLRTRYEILNGALIEAEYRVLHTINRLNVIKSPRYYWEYQREVNEMIRRVSRLRQRKIGGKPVDLPVRDITTRQLPLDKPKKQAS
jgi:hypothetical protein